jgi:modification methylase
MFSDEVYVFDSQRREPRIPFGTLVEHGLLRPGQTLYFGQHGEATAIVLDNGLLQRNGATSSIHAMGRAIRNAPCNGWEHWYYDDADSGERLPIDRLRARLRNDGRGSARMADIVTTAPLYPRSKAEPRASKSNR